jgi:hypothetical protein
MCAAAVQDGPAWGVSLHAQLQTFQRLDALSGSESPVSKEDGTFFSVVAAALTPLLLLLLLL